MLFYSVDQCCWFFIKANIHTKILLQFSMSVFLLKTIGSNGQVIKTNTCFLSFNSDWQLWIWNKAISSLASVLSPLLCSCIFRPKMICGHCTFSHLQQNSLGAKMSKDSLPCWEFYSPQPKDLQFHCSTILYPILSLLTWCIGALFRISSVSRKEIFNIMR